MQQRYAAPILHNARIQHRNFHRPRCIANAFLQAVRIRDAVERHVAAENLKHKPLRLECIESACLSRQLGQMDGMRTDIRPDFDYGVTRMHQLFEKICLSL